MATNKYRNYQEKIRQERGEAVARAYGCWVDMRRRVNNPIGKKGCYVGVTIDKRWDQFETFLTDMGEPPSGMTIARINPKGNYEPNNCDWDLSITHRRNKNDFKLSMERARIIRDAYRISQNL